MLQNGSQQQSLAHFAGGDIAQTALEYVVNAEALDPPAGRGIMEVAHTQGGGHRSAGVAGIAAEFGIIE